MKVRVISLVLAVVILSGGGSAYAGDRPLVAKVNGTGIAQDEFDRDWNAYLRNKEGGASESERTPEQITAMKKEVLDALIGRELLWQEAKKKNVSVDPKRIADEIDRSKKALGTPEEFSKRLAESGFTEASFKDYLTKVFTIQQFIENDIAKTVAISDKDIHEFYVAHPEAMRTPEQVHARHILVKVDQNADSSTKEAAKKKIEGILKEARSGADFAELAKKYSDCPSKQQGGDLGSFQRGQMVKAFEDVAFAQTPGTLSDVVETQFGYHIIKVEEHKQASTAPEKEMSDKIRQFLKYQKMNQAVADYVKGLREKAKVEILMKL